MSRKLNRLQQRYQAAVRAHLKQDTAESLQAAEGLGRRAMALGLETLDLARIHEQALITLVLPSYARGIREAMVRRAGVFFAKAITPFERMHRAAHLTNLHLTHVNDALRQRTVDLVLSNHRLKTEIERRRVAEGSLRQSEQHYGQLLEQSRQMQQQLRFLSRRLLLAQEEERKRISRELHDVIAQTLTGINVRLAALKTEAASSNRGLERSIARTQRLVEHSVKMVHRFARELRPAVLDDLGLIPALLTFMRNFRKETGIRVSLSAFAAVEQVKGDRRTVLYRVAQEALNNIARHAQASQASVKIQKLGGAICLTVQDNGKGFPLERVLHTKKGKRLGLLGMSERLEMVGGNLRIASSPGKGTSVLAQIPLMEPFPGLTPRRPPPGRANTKPYRG